ncbi:MAG TPA: pyridoxamine 5'-phosphate oxidase family protein [Acidimicrobiales bacterium]|nr:pyridoxamine 5'-phosphate oxidase family protein [Acidimicrobiales bacterium]
MSADAPPGDLGRRVAARRLQLGLTDDELATRAAMSVDYVRRIEHDQGVVLRVPALARLAAALETWPGALLGAAVAGPPGHPGAAGAPRLEVIPEDDCWRLVAPGGVGRMVFDADRGPLAVPVNFRVRRRAVVVRTAPGGLLDGLADGQVVGFEVDQIDDAFSRGWSVMATGPSRHPADAEELAAVTALDVEPWAGGDRSAFILVEPDEVTGRRIVTE